MQTVRSIEDTSNTMKDPTFAGCAGHLTYKTEVYQITFYELEYDNVSSKPSIKYSLIIFDDMTFKIWYGGNLIPSDTIPHIVKSNKISLLNEIIEIMDYLKKLKNSIRVRSLIKFSGYTMKEVHNILQKDDSKAQAQIDLYAIFWEVIQT